VSHANAALTPRARLRLAVLIVDRGWTCSAAAAMFMICPRTARKWADRYRSEGPAGMADRSSRPRRSPARTPPSVVRQIVRLRWRHRLGPVQIAGQLGVPASTVHAVLVRCRISRLSRIDRVTGEPLRRYEHGHPGSLIHVDVTKFGNIPDGGGHRFTGRQQGDRNKRATTGLARGKDYKPRTGTAYLHTVIGDHSRVAYAEICADEKAGTAIAVLRRATAWFAGRGVTVERVLSDNGACYRSHAWRDTCAELGISHKRTRPYRPQTNGKIERFHRTLADGWAYARFYDSDTSRRNALPGWLHFYNHHRAHSAIGGLPPISRLTNLPGHHIGVNRGRCHLVCHWFPDLTIDGEAWYDSSNRRSFHDLRVRRTPGCDSSAPERVEPPELFAGRFVTARIVAVTGQRDDLNVLISPQREAGQGGVQGGSRPRLPTGPSSPAVRELARAV
jgi:transposase InsO family protein